MRPTKFRCANFVMHAPEGSTPEECGDLWVERGSIDGQPYLLAVYELDDDEKAALAEDGRLVIRISGHGMPPIALGIDDGPATEKIGEHHVRISDDEIREQLARLAAEGG